MTDSSWSIKAEGLSKKFGLSLRRSMSYGLRDSFAKLAGTKVDSTQLREGEFWSVKDVTFTLNPGEGLGIMGVNGSGKTTLLRILTGVYRPDAGSAVLRGRVGALIAAGAGFSPTLTGRENIHVNGALLGLSPGQIRSRMDEIIAFSELGEFIDMPVKHYSSGMQVRLGFAIAAVSEPDVLLVDEVLAVGDMNFQKKCYDYLFGLKRKGTSIVLVSHSIGAIWAVCDRGLFLDKGEAKILGNVEDVIRAYDDHNSRMALRSREAQKKSAPRDHDATSESGQLISGTGEITCSHVTVTRRGLTQPVTEIEFEEPFDILMELDAFDNVPDFILRVVLDSAHYRNICTIDTHEQGSSIGVLKKGTYQVRLSVHNQNFRPGVYDVNVAAISKHAGVHLFLSLKCASFVVKNPTNKFLYSDPSAVMHLDAAVALEPRTA